MEAGKGKGVCHAMPPGGLELDEYLRDLDGEEIEALRLNLTEDLGEIKGQISKAKARAFRTGDYSDNDWFQRVQGAQRVKANQYNGVCAELRRRRMERAEAARRQDEARRGSGSFAEMFVRVASVDLPVATYEAICARASHLIDQQRCLNNGTITVRVE